MLGLDGPAPAPAGAALRRPAPAGGDGPRARARARGVPAGRAAVEPRRQAPRPDAVRAQAAPRPHRRHDDLRDPRPESRRSRSASGSRCSPSGVLQQVGPPQEVYDHPANVFVAGFIGSPPMNLLTGHRARRATSRSARSSSSGRRAPDGEVLVGIRPEGLRPVGAEHRRAGIRGLRSRSVEPLGDEVLVHGLRWRLRTAPRRPNPTEGILAVETETGRASVIVRLPPGGPPGRRLDPPRRRVAPNALRLFDPATGRRHPERLTRLSAPARSSAEDLVHRRLSIHAADGPRRERAARVRDRERPLDRVAGEHRGQVAGVERIPGPGGVERVDRGGAGTDQPFAVGRDGALGARLRDDDAGAFGRARGPRRRARAGPRCGWPRSRSAGRRRCG